jgi:hypothetical protein
VGRSDGVKGMHVQSTQHPRLVKARVKPSLHHRILSADGVQVQTAMATISETTEAQRRSYGGVIGVRLRCKAGMDWSGDC